MSKMRVLMAGSALGAAMLAGPAAAAVTGTVAATSEYMFRGIDSENGAAVQGSLDWSDPSGFYLGTWASNSNPAGGNELDLYGGYKFKVAESFDIDLGGIYYVFSEDEEGVVGVDNDFDYWEVYAGLTFGGLAAKVYYADNYFNVEDNDFVTPGGVSDGEGIYYTASYNWTIKESLDLKFQIGFSDGDGVKAFIGDEYTDWSVTLTKALENGFAASFAYVQTDIDIGAFEDDAKFVVTLSKGFEI